MLSHLMSFYLKDQTRAPGAQHSRDIEDEFALIWRKLPVVQLGVYHHL